MHMSGFHLPLRSIRGRVSVAANGALVLLFASFLAYDYQHDSADRLERKHTSLEEQARILAPAAELSALLLEEWWPGPPPARRGPGAGPTVVPIPIPKPPIKNGVEPR